MDGSFRVDRVDVSNKRSRRAAATLAVDLITRIYCGEIQRIMNVPRSRSAQEIDPATKAIMDALFDARSILRRAFDIKSDC